jgi:pyruvate ferredoxin oxidoreductase gamma subunit
MEVVFMIQVRWHGRGGQGAFTAAKLLGAAYALGDNRHAIAFPSFGPERRGAPIRAFTKLDNKPIGDRSESKMCDFIVILDDTLFESSYLDDLNENGRVIINSKSNYDDRRIISIDAQVIAEEELKLPITNTAMLGALLGLFNEISEEQILNAVENYMPKKIALKNKNVIIRTAAAIRAKEHLCLSQS